MRDIQRVLLDEVGQRLVKFGFGAKASEQSFIRAMPTGKVAFHLAFIEHPQDFEVVADVAVRFEELEGLVNRDNRLLSKKDKGRTYSLGAELGNLAGTGQMRWQVTSVADVIETADRIVDAFRRIGIPYLDRATTMEGAYELLTAAGRDAWLHCPIHAARAKRVVGLAKLLKRNNELAARVEENTRFLEGIKDAGLQDFLNFAANIAVPSKPSAH